ncbi:MmcQ/YjbR family DNA-binding protein [Edaphobacter modestus]|uniref:TfoX-like protein n=1 Tax=Edaphobacter modestus TaxID=388466 RepID=A0A4Q7YSV1_9BACT|nr:MmcQ/YjbR family DNA-binding protein [Edaphobacter modestus]RZU40827.1 hypothetical protein BDD14_2313 [Edaphobacter modestus]
MSDPELVATISRLLSSLDGMSEKKSGTHASFLAGGKVFAFTRGGGSKGVALKLPRERIEYLTQRDDVAMLTMGKRTMKEWILLEPREPAEYRKDLPLFREAMAYAFADAGISKKKKR